MKNDMVRKSIRMSEEESEMLSKYSEVCGLSESQLIGMLIMGKQPQPLPDKSFWLMLEELYEIHNRLKQLSMYDSTLNEKCIEIEKLILDLQKKFTVPKEVDLFGDNKSVAHKRKAS